MYGTRITEKVFNNISFAGRGVGIPSIGSDGTIYVGCYSTLYAFNPDLSKKWEKDFIISLIKDAPALGTNGVLYISYWRNDNEQVVGKIDPQNGNILWEIPFNLTDYDNIVDIYVDSQGLLCFVISYENGSNPDTYKMYTYKDYGNTYAYIWDREFGESGGTSAYGPGKTLYVIPSSGYGHIITAISEGEYGDPYGVAMGYTNNNSPLQPSNPTPEIGKETTTNVTLSWTCSDPDNHNLKYKIYIGDTISVMLPISKNYIENTTYTLEELTPGTKYIWKVIATDGQAVTEGPLWDFTTEPPVLVEDELPKKFSLTQNFPNPFNITTTISYVIPKASYVKLTIYNIIGQDIKTLVNQYVQPGRYSIKWNGTDNKGYNVTSGIYFYKITAGEFEKTKKMLIIK